MLPSRARRWLPILLLVCAATWSGAAPQSESTTSTVLTQRIDALLNEDAAGTGFWGVWVQDLETGEVVYRHNANKGLVRRLNLKLLTTATALDALGPDYRYRTLLLFDGEVDGGTLRGDLIVRGSGDPTLGTRELPGDGLDPLRTWAATLAEMGVERIEGRIIGDDDIFDERPYAEGWDVDFISREAYAPAVSGLTYRDNVSTIAIAAPRPGQQPSVSGIPTDYFEVRNDVETHNRRRGQRMRIDRNLGEDALRLRGSLPRGYRGQFNIPVSNPTAFAVDAFAHYLRQAGIEVDAPTLDIDDIDPAPQPERAEPLFVHFSPPLSRILAEINKESNNLYAEQVFRTFAVQGATENGERRVKSLLREAGVAEADGISIVDGSGLSRKDLVTAEAMGRVLAHMDAHSDRDVFLASLPRGGEARTTMRYRLGGMQVQAKTGSLKFVRSLSGYVEGAGGGRYAFVVFANNFTAPPYTIKRTIDGIVSAIAGG